MDEHRERLTVDPVASFVEDVMESQQVEVRDAHRVARYLLAHPEIMETLLTAPLAIRSSFGPDVQLAIDIDVDRETTDSKQLVIWIISDQPEDEVVRCYEQFLREWWLRRPSSEREGLQVFLG